MRVKYILSGAYAAMFTCIINGLFMGMAHADYDADNLDSLFTDKKQRALIDATRSGKTTGAELKQTSKIELNGYVKRSDGKSVVWINNKNTLDSSSVDDVKVHKSSIGKNKKVTVSVDGKSKSLKAGQSWHKETGKVVDAE